MADGFGKVTEFVGEFIEAGKSQVKPVQPAAHPLGVKGQVKELNDVPKEIVSQLFGSGQQSTENIRDLQKSANVRDEKAIVAARQQLQTAIGKQYQNRDALTQTYTEKTPSQLQGVQQPGKTSSFGSLSDRNGTSVNDMLRNQGARSELKGNKSRE